MTEHSNLSDCIDAFVDEIADHAADRVDPCEDCLTREQTLTEINEMLANYHNDGDLSPPAWVDNLELGEGDVDLSDIREMLQTHAERIAEILDVLELDLGQGDTFTAADYGTTMYRSGTYFWGWSFNTERRLRLHSVDVPFDSTGDATIGAWRYDDGEIGDRVESRAVTAHGITETYDLDWILDPGTYHLALAVPLARDDANEAYHGLPDSCFEPDDTNVRYGINEDRSLVPESQHGVTFFERPHPLFGVRGNQTHTFRRAVMTAGRSPDGGDSE